MASDDEDESLAKFLESEILSELSDEEEINLEEDEDEGGEEKEETLLREGGGISDEEMEREVKRMSVGGDVNVEEEERQVKRMLVEDGETSEEEEHREAKRLRVGEEGDCSLEGRTMPLMSADESRATSLASKKNKRVIGDNNGRGIRENRSVPNRIEDGIFGKIPPELFHHILKFLSSEDLVSCSMVCRFLNSAASDESLWRRLYCLRWGLLPLKKKLRECAWKKLYIERDEDDMVEFVRHCPPEFKEYYIQMQVAKRSQAPLLSQVCDDRVLLDKTIGDQVSIWKKSRGLSDVAVADHVCSGVTCTYYQIGDVFVCEKTGQVHVCEDTCREVIADSVNELLVCTISGRCFDRTILEDEMEPDQQEVGAADEAEASMGSGPFARAYLLTLGYNCADEKELEAIWRFC